MKLVDAKGYSLALNIQNGFDEISAEERFAGITAYLESPASLMDMVEAFSDLEFMSFLDTIKGIINDFKVLFEATERVKKLINAILRISHRCEEKEAFAKNIAIICDILNCERASIFLYDKLNNKLWTVLAKGSVKIEIDPSQGIGGAVFTTGKSINIEDVYNDKRFNKDFDVKNGFRTKSMICVPIFGDYGDTIGICQAINSRNQAFSQDDEKLLEFLAKHAGTIIKNSMEFQQRDITQNLLRRVLRVFFGRRL